MFKAFALLFMVFLVSCSQESSRVTGPEDSEIDPVLDNPSDSVEDSVTTQSAAIRFGDSEIQTFFQSNCRSCHSGSRASGGYRVTSYEEVTADLAALEREVVIEKTMPTNGNLSSEEIQLIADWIDQGALE